MKIEITNTNYGNQMQIELRSENQAEKYQLKEIMKISEKLNIVYNGLGNWAEDGIAFKLDNFEVGGNQY